MSTQSAKEALGRLSATEKEQLGQAKPLQNGSFSEYAYASLTEWPILRQHFLKLSQAAAARYKPGFVLPDRLTAYTPGETLHLLTQPEVTSWHRQMRNWTIPAQDEQGRAYELIVLVPCAKSKPWANQKVGLYGAYNEIREQVKAGKLPPVYFVTISEPLGVVPEDHWEDFPMYDNPGLFKNESLRASGLMTQDFAKIDGITKKVIVPFDEEAYQESIKKLGTVIGAFMQHNAVIYPSLKWASFVEGFESTPSTHSEMLDVATAKQDLLPVDQRFTKKAAPRTRPVEHLRQHIEALTQGVQALASKKRTKARTLA